MPMSPDGKAKAVALAMSVCESTHKALMDAITIKYGNLAEVDPEGEVLAKLQAAHNAAVALLQRAKELKVIGCIPASEH